MRSLNISINQLAFPNPEKMKRIALLLLCAIMACTTNAQNRKSQFKLGEAFALPKNTTDIGFYGNETSGLINLSFKKDKLFLNSFNYKNLSKTGSKTIKLKNGTPFLRSEKVLQLNNSYHWLRSVRDSRRKKDILYSTAIDIKNCNLAANENVLVEIDAVDPNAAVSKMKYFGRYVTALDFEQKKLLVAYKVKPSVKGGRTEKNKVGIVVFDDHLKKIWGQEFSMPYANSVMENVDFSIDGSGNAYLLSRIYDTDTKREYDKTTRKPAYHLEVFKLTEGKEPEVYTNFSLGEFFVREGFITENANHDMVLICSYGKDKDYDGSQGIFVGITDKKGTIANHENSFHPFPRQEILKHNPGLAKDLRDSTVDAEIPGIQILNLVRETDGSITLATERQRAIFVPGGGQRGYTKFYYGDIYTFKVDASGKRNWFTMIPKAQLGYQGKGTMSYSMLTSENGYHFLFLDNLKNQDSKDEEGSIHHKDRLGGQVAVSKIDNNGSRTQEIIFDVRQQDFTLYPSEFKTLQNRHLIGRAKISKKSFQPILITLKN